MNIQNITRAMIGVLIYEIVLKLFLTQWPELFNQTPIFVLKTILAILSSLIFILFLVLFLWEERLNRIIEKILKILIICTILHFLLRLPFIKSLFEIQYASLFAESLGLLKAVFMFSLLIVYTKTLPSTEKRLIQTAAILSALFGIGMVKSGYSFFTFLKFFISGIMIHFSPQFYTIMLVLFITTHLAIIYFLWEYYLFKSKKMQKE
jgi:hypothetical protein